MDRWNSLPLEVISAPSVDAFKVCLDKHWSNVDWLYCNHYNDCSINILLDICIGISNAFSNKDLSYPILVLGLINQMCVLNYEIFTS